MKTRIEYAKSVGLSVKTIYNFIHNPEKARLSTITKLARGRVRPVLKELVNEILQGVWR